MKGRLGCIILAALSAAMACNPQGAEKDRPVTLVPVQLAVRVGGGSQASTKTYPTVIKEINEGFRGVTDIVMLPFDERRAVVADDVANFHPSYLPDIVGGDNCYTDAAVIDGEYTSGLVSNNHAHLWSSADANLPGGTGSVLAYGQPPEAYAGTELARKQINGSLTADGLGAMSYKRSASEVSFSHAPIYESDVIPVEAETIASILSNVVAGASYSFDYYWYKDTETAAEAHQGSLALTWNESIGDSRLSDYFKWITNNGQLTTACGHNMEFMLTQLYKYLLGYTSDNTAQYMHHDASGDFTAYRERACVTPLTYEYLYNSLRQGLLNRFQAQIERNAITIDADNNVSFVLPELHNYPASYGLPEGAAIMRWTGLGYEPASEELDGLAPINSFCFPPSLWYFANTTISVSGSDREDDYVSSNQDWSTILGKYTTGKVIRSDTKSVALDQPLNYSCAKLVVSVRASNSTLRDAENTNAASVTLTDSSFPVTGVIVGSQHQLNFDFTPADDEGLSLYDVCIDGVYMKYYSESQASEAPSFSTLVSQSPDGEDVYFCLELRNDCGKAFKGADGIVVPGAKFYFVGVINLASSQPRIFTKDYYTSVKCKITSLADARTAVPDMLKPQLSLGLEVSVSWTLTDGVTVILY